MQKSTHILLATLLISPACLAADGHDNGHGLKHHALGVFVGRSNERGGGDEVSIGLEYEYRFNQHWGAGGLVEYTPDGHSDDGITVALASGYYHPYKGWRLGLGFGRERVHGDHGYYQWLYRAGVAYDFHVGRFGIAPSVNYDIIEGNSNVLIYGVALVYPF